jgi:hypothetical protein
MKTSILCTSLFALMASSEVSGFAPASKSSASTTTQISAAANDEGDSRRQFLSQALATGFTYSAAALATTGVLAPLPANAASAESKVNARLKA